MKKFNSTPLFLLLVILMVSCNKPEADFTTDKNEYSAGDVIYITNNSDDSKEYFWYFSNNASSPSKQSVAKNPTDTINMLAPDGVYTIQLTASRKKGKKPSTVRKDFLVKTLRGSFQINSPIYYDGTTVFADNQLIGKISGGLFSVKLPIGVRLIEVFGPNGRKSTTVKITEGGYYGWQID